MELVRSEFRAMASACEIVAAGPDGAGTRHAIGLAAREVIRIERKYSRYRTDQSSIVHRINASAGNGEWVACDEETSQLLELAARLHQLSDGLFDVTSGILRRVWNFSGGYVPGPDELAQVLPLIGWTMVDVDSNGVRLQRPGMEIDFGGIGKEYAADRAAGVLNMHGIAHGYVNLGGDIRVAGPRIGGEPWRFGVQDPRDAGAIAANIALTGGALVTSGDYVKFIEKNGKRFCHILNPRTGISASCWRSVSVVGVSAVMAGAYATIAMLKEADAVTFLDEVQCQYLLIGAEGNCISSQKKPEGEFR
jgi:thiamine biosynthesis lipoprotein